MRWHPQPENLRSTRKSRAFYPEEPGLARIVQAASGGGYYIFLLRQDLDFTIPYSAGRPGGPQARVTGPDAQKAAPLIEQALGSEEHGPDLSDSVRHFVSSVAQDLVTSGPVTCEIDYLYSRDSAVAPVEFRLEPLLPGTISRHGRQPIQYVPSDFGGPQDKTGLTYVELDPATLVTFDLDPSTTATVRRIITFLHAAGSRQGPGGLLPGKPAGASWAYSPAEYDRELGDLIAEVTEPIGWNARALFQDNRLAPYEVWRQLRFTEFKIRLRERIMTQLNAALATAGTRLGFQAAIEFKGLLTLQDVESAKTDLRNGRRTLDELTIFALQ